MKKGLLTLTLCGLVMLSMAQSTDAERFFKQNQQIRKKGMLVLGSWAAGNMIVGGIGTATTDGTTRYFHQMNVGWNAVNLAIAGLGYWGAAKEQAPENHYLLAKHHFDFQKVLLFNAGIDLAYMTAGAWLIQRAQLDALQADQLRGFGQSLILQGAFLFVFDLSMATILAKQNPRLAPLLSHLQIGPGSLSYTF
jgi:hypothetical protein